MTTTVANFRFPFRLLKALSIPYLMVFDKDYLLKYARQKRADSVDSNGFPIYNYDEIKTNSLINELIPNPNKIDELLKTIKKNHSKALDLFEEFDLVCMNYSIELDLIKSKAAREQMNIIFNLKTNTDNLNDYTARSNQLKKAETLIKIIDKLEHKNLPNSYKRIIKIIKNI